MKPWLELFIFVAIAMVFHVLAFAQWPRSGSAAGGSGGEALVSLEAARSTVVEMVERWDQPVQVASEIRADVAMPEPVQVVAPVLPRLELDETPRSQMQLAVAQPETFDEIEVDTSLPAPPAPAPNAVSGRDTRPKTRPRQKKPDEGVKAETVQESVAAQRSAGSGEGAQAGSGNARVATATAGRNAKLKSVWGARIRSRIERNKRYPRGATQSGSVVVELVVSRNGRLLRSGLRASSGVPKLDQAALGAVTRTRRYPNAPKGLAGDSFLFRVKIHLQPR